MSKGTNIGLLNFGISGDNKQLIESLKEAQKEAEKTKKVIDGLSGKGKAATMTTFNQIALNNARVNEVNARSTKNQTIQEQKLLTEIQRTEAARSRANIANMKAIAQQNSGLQQMRTSAQGLSGDMDRLNKLFMRVGGSYALIRLGSEIINVRGEFQQLGIAFETMLGSKEKADAMMADLKDFALKTPFTLTEVAANTKQLIAMGIETDKVMDTMKALGDVAAGVSIPISRIAINYGQVSALGRLQAREIRDFAMAGVPIVEELASLLGKTAAEITNMVSAGQIGMPEVEAAFMRMSSEGGKFYNLMEKQNASVTGQVSKLKDQLQMMFDAIGESSEGIIYGSLDVLTTLVTNYEKVGKLVASLVTTYGVYRTAVMLAIAAESSWTIAQMANYKWLLLVEKATKLLNAAMLKNPYVLVATLLTGVVTAMWALSDSTDAAAKAQERLNTQNQEQEDFYKKRRSDVEALLNVLRDENETELAKIKAYEELTRLSPALTEKYNQEALAVLSLADANKVLNEERDAASYANIVDNISRINTEIEKLEKVTFQGESAMVGEAQKEKKLAELRAELALYQDTKKKTDALKNQTTAEPALGQTYAAALSEALNEWKAAKEELQKIERDKDAFSVEQYEKAKARQDAAAKRWNSLGGYRLDGEKSKPDDSAYIREQARFEEDLQTKVAQARINAMAEGTEKTIAQMKLNHATELHELERQKEDFLKRIVDRERALFDADLANEKVHFNASTISLTNGQEAAFEALRRNIQNRQRSEMSNHYSGLLKDFQTYQERRTEILRKSAENEANIIAAGGSDGNLSENKRQTNTALEQLDEQFVEREETFQAWMDEITKMTLGQLVETLRQAELALSISRLNISTGGEYNLDAATLREQVKALKEQVHKEYKELEKDTASTGVKDWRKTQKVIHDVNKELKEIGENIGGAAGELIAFAADLSGGVMEIMNGIDQIAKKSIDGLEETGEAAIRAMSTVEKAAVILTIISAALKTINLIKDAFGGLKDSERDKAEYTKILIELQDEYNNKLIETMLLQNEVFGSNSMGDMLSAVEALNKATENYFNTLNSSQDAWKDPTTNFFEKLYKTITVPGWFNMFLGDNDSTRALKENLRYITKKSSNGVLGIGGNHTKTQDLTEWVKANLGTDLFYENGRLNLEVAVSLVNTSSDRLTEQTKESLDKLIEAEEAIRSAEEAMAEYISQTFGSLGDAMSDSIVQAFKNGSDAAKLFRDDVVGVLEDVEAQIVRNLFLQKIIDEYSTALDDAFKTERIGTDEEQMKGMSNDIFKATEDFFNGFTNAIENSNQFLEWFQTEGKKHGYDLYQPDGGSRDSLVGGIQGVTEDTAGLLSSYINAIRADVAMQLYEMRQFVIRYNESQNTFANMLSQLQMIEQNTRINSESVIRIERMIDDLSTIGGTRKLNV